MNWNHVQKRQRKYALTLFSQKKIDQRVYGLMLIGWAEYFPDRCAVVDYTRICGLDFKHIPITV